MSARKLFQIVDSCPASAHTSAHASAHLSAQPYVKLPEPIEGERIGGELTGQIGDIAFKDTRFTYASRQGHPVLQGLTFEVKQGTKVALVGESGCGKSTAFALLQKFYDVPAGSITVNGACISEVDTDWLRSEMGVVNQEPVLFNATIKENILYGVDEEKTTMDDVIKACKLSNIHEFIMNLRKGYDTFVGEGGDRLSGGQKQRISIARAVIRQPSLILLDEATSALDPTCEKEVQKALDNILSERTSITIAHKLKTIENSDKIFVLCKGSIVESGTHSELLKNDGIYHKMVLTQKIK